MAIFTPVRVAGFQHRVADHSASGALRDLLEHHRLSFAPEPLSEGAVFGLSGALDLRVQITPRGVPALDLDGRSPSFESELCAHLGLGGELVHFDDADAGWQLLRHELDAGRPTLVRADLSELDYRDRSPHDTRHAIVVTSYDLDTDVAWVADANFPEPQRCSLTALAGARASSWGLEPVRHALLRLRPGTRLADPRDAITAALRFGVRHAGTSGALHRPLQARFEHDAAALLGSAHLGRAALVCDDLSDAWRALAAATEDEDGARAHQVAWPWVQRVYALERSHVEALEAHLAA